MTPEPLRAISRLHRFVHSPTRYSYLTAGAFYLFAYVIAEWAVGGMFAEKPKHPLELVAPIGFGLLIVAIVQVIADRRARRRSRWQPPREQSK